jgi:hypothetical protein
VTAQALEALRNVLDESSEPDDVLRATVEVLAAEPAVEWAGIAFNEEGRLALGPQAGEPDEARRARVPVHFQGRKVGELWVDGDVERAFLEQVAALLSAHVLIGWDTGGEPWEP